MTTPLRIGTIELGRRPCIVAAGGEGEVHALCSAEGADVTAFRYWELSEINSVSGGLAGGWANVDQRRHPALAAAPDSSSRQTYEVLQGGYSRKLHRFAPKNGESRTRLRRLGVEPPPSR